MMKSNDSFIGQPIRSMQNMLRVLSEYDPSYTRIIPDGIYGPDTVSAVSTFQRKHALPVTGVVNQETWDTIVGAYDSALPHIDSPHPLNVVWAGNCQRGGTDPNIYLIQCMLSQIAKKYGSICAPQPTGVLDEATADALSSFQILCGLPMTGEADKLTWKHLALQYPLGCIGQNRQE